MVVLAGAGAGLAAVAVVMAALVWLARRMRRRGTAGQALWAAMAAYDEAMHVTAYEAYVEVQAEDERGAAVHKRSGDEPSAGLRAGSVSPHIASARPSTGVDAAGPDRSCACARCGATVRESDRPLGWRRSDGPSGRGAAPSEADDDHGCCRSRQVMPGGVPTLDRCRPARASRPSSAGSGSVPGNREQEMPRGGRGSPRRPAVQPMVMRLRGRP